MKDLKTAIVKCDELEKIKILVKKALDAGAKPLGVVDAVREALNEVGDLYSGGEYFLMELVMAGSAASEIVKMVEPELKRSDVPLRGKVVIGTVFGDLHNIGKDIVIAMLKSQVCDVIDLGVDVPTAKFVESVKKEKPDILAMSGLLTIVRDEMKKVIDALSDQGLRETVKVMIGGRAVSEAYAKQIGADAFGASAIDAVRLATKWLKGE